MVKIVKASEMMRIEALSYQEGAQEEQFMRKAAERIVECIEQTVAQLHIQPKLLFLCGKGNNGGDGYAAATLLMRAKGGVDVQVCALSTLQESSPLCQKMRQEFMKTSGATVMQVTTSTQIDFTGRELIIDALWGTGFKGQLPKLYEEVIEKANQSKLPILAVDIPSGINGNDGQRAEVAIKAYKTLFLGLPKTGCFIGEAYEHVGEVAIYDFGLPEKYVEQAKADFILVEKHFAASLLPPMHRTRHKYEAGYVVGVGGSLSMPGAPLLASEAALRAGAGIVRLMHPEGMQAELSKAIPELIHQAYKEGDVQSIVDAASRAKALFIGPGMGVSAEAEALLAQLLPQVKQPCVLDADGLTLLAKNDFPLPVGAILTPHHGEMKRLLALGERKVSAVEFIELAQAYARTKQITLVLKGAPTIIFHRSETPFIVTQGDPGMATAGSGDVLTGIIAALLAQGKGPREAAILGCYLHALAGERAAKERTSYAMIASDITNNLQNAFKFLLDISKNLVF